MTEKPPEKEEGIDAVPEVLEDAPPSVRAVAVITAGLLFAIVLILGLAALLVVVFTPADSPFNLDRTPDAAPGGRVPPGPRLQVSPGRERLQLQQSQMEILNSYGWVDQEAGTARIPIERAMTLLAEAGLPVAEGTGEDPRVRADESGFAHTELDPNRQNPGEGEAALEPFQGDELSVAAPRPTTPAPSEGELVETGAQLFLSLGCNGCHTGLSGAIAPPVAGVFGKPIELEGGETVIADETFLRESITDPNLHIVAGYPPIMPSYQGRVTAQELEALVEYIKSLE